jgi:hypothetical protein
MDKLRSYYEDPSNFEADPGYVFSRDEDLAAAEAAAAARGYNNSGRLMAELGDRANKLSYTHLADASNRLNTYGKDSHAAGIADQQAATQALRAYTGGMGDLSNLFQRYNPSNASTGYVNALTNARSVQGDNNASIAGVGGKVLGNVVGKGLDKLFEGW